MVDSGTLRDFFFKISGKLQHHFNLCIWENRRGIPLYGFYRYVLSQRLCFSAILVRKIKLGIDFGHFVLKEGIGFCTLVLNLFPFLEEDFGHRVKILGSRLHNPTRFLGEYPPSGAGGGGGEG